MKVFLRIFEYQAREMKKKRKNYIAFTIQKLNRFELIEKNDYYMRNCVVSYLWSSKESYFDKNGNKIFTI